MRWVWNSEDYVWTEVYSEHQKRWIHVDACEGAWDQPRLYTEGMLATALRTLHHDWTNILGWGRKLSYCVAFSIDGATDVTRRYVRSPVKYGGSRTKVSEEVLLWVILEIRKQRRDNLQKTDSKRLKKEDEREEKELRTYMASGFAAELTNMFHATRSRSDEQKTPASREEAEWLTARQRQSGHSGPDRSQEGR